jgi:hypothetical protein
MDSGTQATAEQPLPEQPGRDALPSFHHSTVHVTPTSSKLAGRRAGPDI